MIDNVKLIENLVQMIYKAQKSNSKQRGHKPPDYSIDILKDWLLKQSNFDTLLLNWLESDLEIDLKPSIDRINEDKGYTISNIRLITWRENYLKSRNRSKEVMQISFDGKTINKFKSISEASRITGKYRNGISDCCNGSLICSGGFRWEFA